MYCHLSFPISKSSSELMKGSQASPLHRDLSKSELLGKVSSFKDLPMKPKDLGISIEVDMAVKREQIKSRQNRFANSRASFGQRRDQARSTNRDH